LKGQTILSLSDPDGKVAGFINLVPGGSPGKANFDLMRSTDDAPGGTMDVIFVNMFDYLKSKGFRTCTLGMVPLSGIEKPGNVEERVIKLAYEKIRQFSHYRGLHSFKEKFEPDWEMMYLAYNDPYDLFYLPRALDKVIQP
jgi:phosphatidylglycerol lysyltransferase